MCSTIENVVFVCLFICIPLKDPISSSKDSLPTRKSFEALKLHF